MKVLRLTAIGLMAVAAVAQTDKANAGNPSATSDRPVIEVASIRVSDPATCPEYPIIDGRNDRYDMKCVGAKFLIQTAFNVRDFQISGGPAGSGRTDTI